MTSCESSRQAVDGSVALDDRRFVDVTDGPDQAGFLQGLVQGMRCGILAIDTAGRIRLANRQARRLLEIPIVPAGVDAAVALVAHPRLVQVLNDVFKLSSLPNRAELGLGRDGGRTIGFTLSLVKGPDGETVGAAMFFKDLTQIEHKEEQERLKDRLAALGQMAAGLAHEIRNPLASIEVTSSLLKRRVDDSESVALLEKIVAEVKRLNATVSTSLEFVRPLALTLEPAPLASLIDEAIAVAKGRCHAPGIVVHRELPPDLRPFLMDRSQLRQVFENLVLNAMEALGERGTIAITADVMDAPADATIPYHPPGAGTADPWPRADQFVVVRVTDSGPGIEEDDLDRIFQPLFTTKQQGSGIGLAVARKIVTSHRGVIDVASRPGQGAEFSIRIPMALQNPEV